jgi:hypothetical protein
MKTRDNEIQQASQLIEDCLHHSPIMDVILSEMDIGDCLQLSRSCRAAHQFFQAPSPLPRVLQLSKLVHHIVHQPHDGKVQFILNANLELLKVVFPKTIRGPQTLVDVTALQLAFGTGDGVMCQTLKPFFVKLYGSEEAAIIEMKKQINEMTINTKVFDFSSIYSAIAAEQFNQGRDTETGKWILSPLTLTAIQQFRKGFDTHQANLVSNKGLHFEWKTLWAASSFLMGIASRVGDSDKRCKLFADAVLAYVFGHLPQNAAQYFNQGLYYLQKENPAPFMRMPKTQDGHDFYDLLKQPSLDFMLDGRCVDIIFGQQIKTLQSHMPVKKMHERIEAFCKTKSPSAILQSLCTFSSKDLSKGMNI